LPATLPQHLPHAPHPDHEGLNRRYRDLGFAAPLAIAATFSGQLLAAFALVVLPLDAVRHM
jgi:hypothetical protein